MATMPRPRRRLRALGQHLGTQCQGCPAAAPTAPAPPPLSSEADDAVDVDPIVRRLADEGWALIPSVLPEAEARRLEALCRRRIEAKERAGRQAGGHATGGGEAYVSLEDALNVVPELAPLCAHPLVLAIAGAVLGEDCYLGVAQVRVCRPGTQAGALHADWALRAAAWGGYRESTQPAAPPYGGLQAFWMLSEGTADSGSTRIVPFSHHTGRGPSPARQGPYPGERSVVAKRGSLFVFHNGLWVSAATACHHALPSDAERCCQHSTA